MRVRDSSIGKSFSFSISGDLEIDSHPRLCASFDPKKKNNQDANSLQFH